MRSPTLSCPPTLLLALAVLYASESAAQEIWVFTDAQHPLSGVHSSNRVVQMDAPQHLLQALNGDLPSSPQQAASLVRQRLATQGPAFQTRLADAYQGVLDARSLGVKAVPAVIVDKRYVVYGEPDVGKALELVKRYRREHP